MATATAKALPRDLTQCESLMVRAKESLAGGDSSNMRVVPYHLPLVAERGEGALVWDADGREYIDLNMAYGPLLFGHCPPLVIDAVGRQISQCGSQLGFPTEISVRVAEKLKRLYPSIDLVRFANSGTEALMFASRLVRAVTGRKKLVIFEGNYHGWSDAVFHRYHAPLEMLAYEDFGPPVPGTLGMNGAPHEVVCVRANDLEALSRAMAAEGHDVAGVFLEPIMCNSGCLPPEPGFLEGVREITRRYGSMLVFDEVITGLRVAAGGAQELYGVAPDVTVISKALGGGYPVAAVGARREVMDWVARGELFHGGVYAGNALVMAAAEAVLDEVLEHREEIYSHLDAMGRLLAEGLRQIMTRIGAPHVVHQVGPIVSLFLTTEPVTKLTNYRAVRQYGDFDRYITLQHESQRRGVYYHPNMFETMFLSTAHTAKHLETALERIEDGARRCLTA